MGNIDSVSIKLVRRCCCGDEAAWNEIVDKHKRYVMSVITRTICGSGHRKLLAEAEDFFFATFERLLDDDCRRLKFYDGSSPLEVWLAIIAKRLIFSRLRKLNTKKQIKIVLIEPRDEDDTEDDALDRIIEKTGRYAATDTTLPGETDKEAEEEKFNKLTAGLSEEEQLIIKLRYWEKMSQKEIARFTGIKQGTVGSILSRALKKLKDGHMQ